MIYSGKVDDISWSNGTWLILDIGFSNSQKSCGLLLGDDEAKQLKFNDAINEVIRIAKGTPLLNLVIEAPLSVAFDKCSNPKVRSIDKKGGQSRPWYVGPGCAMMVATMYLVKKLYKSNPSAEVRLFEGFVSFKSKEAKSSHAGDVELLRKVIKERGIRNHYFHKPEDLRVDPEDYVESAFKVMNMDLGIPPIIKVP